MELTYACSRCDAVQRIEAVESRSGVACTACGNEKSVSSDAFEGEQLRACGLCSTEDLYIQKDFPQGLGLAIVIAGFVVSSVFWYYEKPLYTYAILLASALLDMLLFYKMPNVTICYRCLAQYRGPGANPGGRFHPFDLAVGERYRQERIRVEELRTRSSGGPAAS